MKNKIFFAYSEFQNNKIVLNPLTKQAKIWRTKKAAHESGEYHHNNPLKKIKIIFV